MEGPSAATGADTAAGEGPSAKAALNISVPTGVSDGTCPLICQGLTADIGAALPFISSETPPRLRGKGSELAPINVSSVKLVPYAVASDPAVTGDPAAAPTT